MYRIHYFLIIFLLAFTYSCGDETSVDKLNDIKSDASNFEDGVSTAIEYNDGVISEIALLDLKMMALNEKAENGLDESYPVLYEECLNEYERVSAVIRKVTPVGVGGADFKSSTIEYLDNYGEMLEYYTSESMTIILEQLNNEEEQNMEKRNYVNEFFRAVNNLSVKFDMLGEAQVVFASKNDFLIKEDGGDLEEIYEETK